jgi:small subunit ribosomal protein S18
MDQNPSANQPSAEADESADSGPRYSRGPRQFIKISISDATLINYKNVEFLRQFISDSGKLRPRRQTGISAHQQRQVAQAVKRARHLALLPFSQGFAR